jgi:hypothetical protein
MRNRKQIDRSCRAFEIRRDKQGTHGECQVRDTGIDPTSVEETT